MASVPAIPKDGPWFRAQGSYGGLPTMIRARQDLLPFAGIRGYAHRVTVTWKLRNPHANGLPSDVDYDELRVFEEAATNLSERHSVLTSVFTNAAVVTYHFYSANAADAAEMISRGGGDQAPIEISIDADPEWAEYRSVLRACGFDDAAI